MSVISIRLPDKLLNQLDHMARFLHIKRAEYIRKAIEHMNEEIDKNERKEKLIQASLRVRNDSMRINKEFSDIEHDENS
jgi:metal-responsive CopG/Arc/MetJ family transcriptional regulator